VFDVIIGNPPYNAGGNAASGRAIWQKFVVDAWNYVDDGGYICFITPTGWRHPNKVRLREAHIHDIVCRRAIYWENCKAAFGSSVGTSIDIDYWVVQKTKEPIRDIQFLPKSSNDLISLSIFQKLHAYNGTKLKKSKGYVNAAGSYKLAGTSKQYHGEWKTIEGKKSISHDNPKVIFSSSGDLGAFYNEGGCSVKNHSHAIVVNDQAQADEVIQILTSMLVKFISSHLVPAGSLENPVAWFVEKLPDHDPYRALCLMPEEIDHIERTVQ